MILMNFRGNDAKMKMKMRAERERERESTAKRVTGKGKIDGGGGR